MPFPPDGKASFEGVREDLSMFLFIDNEVGSVSDQTLELLHQIASDMNQLKRQLLPSVTIAACNHRHCPAGDNLYQDICRWLIPPDPWKNYHIARGSRQSGTGTWFVQGDTLPKWMASKPSALLWVHGKRELPLNT